MSPLSSRTRGYRAGWLGHASLDPSPTALGTVVDRRHAIAAWRRSGTLLLSSVEEHVRREHGRVLVIETSASTALAATRRFYRAS